MQYGDGSLPFYSIAGIVNALSDNGGTLTFLANNTSELTFTGTADGYGSTFISFYNYSSSGWTYGDYYISGGKFAFDLATATNVTIVTGHSVVSNTDDDSATFPYKVVAN